MKPFTSEYPRTTLIDAPQFEALFKAHFSKLHHLATSIVKDPDIGEDVVQEVMLDLWKRREKIEFRVSAEQYLKGATVRRALKRWKQEQKTFSLLGTGEGEVQERDAKTQETACLDQKALLKSCLEELPPRTGLVFRLAKMEGLTQQEVGDYLEISFKTVENQMLRAFRLLRDCVKRKSK